MKDPTISLMAWLTTKEESQGQSSSSYIDQIFLTANQLPKKTNKKDCPDCIRS